MSSRRFSKSNCTSLTRQGVPGKPSANPKTAFSSIAGAACTELGREKRKRSDRELKLVEPASSSHSSPVLRSQTHRSRPLGNRSNHPHTFIQSLFCFQTIEIYLQLTAMIG